MVLCSLWGTKLTTFFKYHFGWYLFGVCVARYAASIDDILEEEEHYADQLKEYLFYTEAVR